MRKKTISHTELFKIIQPHYANILNLWFNRKVIDIKGKNPGRGRVRQYSWPEAVNVAAMVALMPTGRAHRLNARIAALIAERAAKKNYWKWVEDYIAGDGAALVYQLFKKENIFNVKFIALGDLSIRNLILDGEFVGANEICVINCDELIARFAEQIILLQKGC